MNLKTVYSSLYTSFKAHRVAGPKTSASTILNKALNCSQNVINKVQPLPISLFHYKRIKSMALRRLQHEPIQYITKKVEFRGLHLEVEKPVVIPNPVSEKMIDITHELFPTKEDLIHFLEVGCGNGALSLSLLKEKQNFHGVAIDKFLPALELTGRNFNKVFGKKANMEDRLTLVQSDFKKFAEETIHKFDVIMAHPPCLPSSEWEKLTKEIKLHEIRDAIDGGQYGLDKVWEVLRTASECLKKEGYIILQMHEDQPEYLESYFREQGGVVHNLRFMEIREDSSFIKRFVVLQKETTPQVEFI